MTRACPLFSVPLNRDFLSSMCMAYVNEQFISEFYKLNERQIGQYIEMFEKVVFEEVEEFKPDIIHAQHLWIAPYIAAKTGVPYVVTAHGTDLKGFVKDERYRNYALEGAEKASKIITISKQVDREVSELYGVDDDKKQIVMNGYDEELFLPL